MKKSAVLAAVLAVAMAGPAFAATCPKEMAAIDAALAKSPKLSAGDMTSVKKMRADGENLHKAGKHKESVDELAKAKKLLGI